MSAGVTGFVRVGILGATSFVGECVLEQLAQAGIHAIAYTRGPLPASSGQVSWRSFESAADETQTRDWISLLPLPALVALLPRLENCHVRRIVALSSTSVESRRDAADAADRELAQRLAEAEASLRLWAEAQGSEWVVLRPTLIYGRGKDRNIAAIAQLIRRFRFFPLLSGGAGLRQPVHAEDVAQACVAALRVPTAAARVYTVSGAETLPYRTMVERVFTALRIKPRFLDIPLFAFRAAVALMRLLPSYRDWSGSMAERMKSDLVYGYADAERDLGFRPRPFSPEVGPARPTRQAR